MAPCHGALDHPVYDCLYLACAEATSSVLITADHRFAKKAAGATVDVWVIGSAAVTDQVARAATPPIIGGDKVEELIKAYEFFARTERHVVAGIDSRTEGLTFLTPADMDLFLNSPSYRRLVSLVSDLSDEERLDLLALGWLGCFDRQREPEWRCEGPRPVGDNPLPRTIDSTERPQRRHCRGVQADTGVPEIKRPHR